MTFKEHSDLVISLVNKVDNFWNIFFLTNLGIISWFFSKEKSLPISYTIIASIAYFFYLIINCSAHIRGYRFLNLALKELKLNLSSYDIKSEELINNLSQLNYGNRTIIVAISYLIALFVMISVFWMKHFEII